MRWNLNDFHIALEFGHQDDQWQFLNTEVPDRGWRDAPKMPGDHVQQPLLVGAVGEVPTPGHKVLGKETKHCLSAENLFTDRSKLDIHSEVSTTLKWPGCKRHWWGRMSRGGGKLPASSSHLLASNLTFKLWTIIKLHIKQQSYLLQASPRASSRLPGKNWGCGWPGNKWDQPD